MKGRFIMNRVTRVGLFLLGLSLLLAGSMILFISPKPTFAFVGMIVGLTMLVASYTGAESQHD